MADLPPLAITANSFAIAGVQNFLLYRPFKLLKSHFLPLTQSGVLQHTVIITVHLFCGFTSTAFVVRAGTADFIGLSYKLQGCRSLFLQKPTLHCRHMCGKSITLSLPLEEIKAHTVMRTNPVSLCLRHFLNPVRSVSEPCPVSCSRSVPVRSSPDPE